MAGISLDIDSPLKDMLIAVRRVPAEVRKQINTATRNASKPIWFEETRGRANNRLQQRALVNSATVGVTNRNVFLRSGSKGRLSTGTGVADVAKAAEFGANPNMHYRTRSRKGKSYTRRQGTTFGPVTRKGKVVYPAARDSIPRFASLWVQTATRTILDALDLKA